MIPYGKQTIDESDIESVVEVLRSDFITQGEVVPRFEQAIADYCGARFAVSVNSATSALHLACLALGVGPGDLVWTTANSFVASANCALYCGARVDFVDIELVCFNLCPKALREKLQKASQIPKVLVVVDMCGHPAALAEISELAREYKFKIIEDASHAIGSTYRQTRTGSCSFSDITIFSFHPVKLVTTGEGGVAATNDEELFAKMSLLRSHGVTRDRTLWIDHARTDPWYYEQLELGYNYRMTEIQAALGLSQLSKLDEFLRRRWEIVDQYSEMLSELPIILPQVATDSVSSFHLYVVRLQLGDVDKTHLQIFDGLRARGVGVNLHYFPIYLQPYYKRMGFVEGYCPNAETYYKSAMSLPIYPKLTAREQNWVAQQLGAELRQ